MVAAGALLAGSKARGSCLGFSKEDLSFFLICIVEVCQASGNRGVCILKGVFLAPMDDGGRAYALHDPVVNGAVRTRVQQDVCDVIADRQSRIWGFWRLFCRDQWTRPMLPNRALWGI